MSLRLYRTGWLVVGSAWLAASVVGCGDGDDINLEDAAASAPRDGGGLDAGTGKHDSWIDDLDASDQPLDGGAAQDAAREASASATCGSPPKVCTAHTIPSVGDIAAGCALNYQDAEVCGISSQHVLMGAEPKFLEKNAKGAASASCGAFYDSLETADGGTAAAAGIGNGRIDKGVVVAIGGAPMTLRISYPGCCTEKGFCSGDGNKGMSAYGPSQSGFGCMDSASFFRYLPEVGRPARRVLATRCAPFRVIPPAVPFSCQLRTAE